MEKPLRNKPTFDADVFHTRTEHWPRGARVLIEWSTMTGPNCYVYPAGERAKGIKLTNDVGAVASDERWADFLEFEFIPPVADALSRDGFRPEVICVDLRPLRVQRARRREIEAAGHAKSGSTGH